MASASPGGAESVPRGISQGRRLSLAAWSQRRTIIRSITHAPDHTVARLRLLHGSSRSRRSRHRILSNPNDFHFFSGLEAQPHPVAEIVPDTQASSSVYLCPRDRGRRGLPSVRQADGPYPRDSKKRGSARTR
jgi:hypothetical protein